MEKEMFDGQELKDANERIARLGEKFAAMQEVMDYVYEAAYMEDETGRSLREEIAKEIGKDWKEGTLKLACLCLTGRLIRMCILDEPRMTAMLRPEFTEQLRVSAETIKHLEERVDRIMHKEKGETEGTGQDGIG